MELTALLWWCNAAFLVAGVVYYAVKIVSQQPDPTTMQPCLPIRPKYEDKQHKLKHQWKLLTSEASMEAVPEKDHKLVTG